MEAQTETPVESSNQEDVAILERQLDEIEGLISTYTQVIEDSVKKKAEMKVVYEHLCGVVNSLMKKPEQGELEIAELEEPKQETE